VVVQVGCPWDLIKAGRSRGIYFSHFVGKDGRVVIIEPDQENSMRLKSYIEAREISNIIPIDRGAWDSKAKLGFLSNPRRPAASIVESLFDSEARKDRGDFAEIEIEVDSLDNILGELGVDKIDLVSITTNGAEEKILSGMTKILPNTRYISLIKNSQTGKYLRERGFRLVAEDDRGWTLENQSLKERCVR
jgi:FkbM family methyltransferase